MHELPIQTRQLERQKPRSSPSSAISAGKHAPTDTCSNIPSPSVPSRLTPAFAYAQSQKPFHITLSVSSHPTGAVSGCIATHCENKVCNRKAFMFCYRLEQTRRNAQCTKTAGDALGSQGKLTKVTTKGARICEHPQGQGEHDRWDKPNYREGSWLSLSSLPDRHAAAINGMPPTWSRTCRHLLSPNTQLRHACSWQKVSN